MKTKMTALLFSVLSIISVKAATLAVIDSGTDMKHKEIAPYAWMNPVEIPGNNRDEDRNGYQDDIFGWNFAEKNNMVIDYSYLGTLNDDIRRLFDIQAKMFYGTVTEEEMAWIRTMVKNEAFMKRLSIYGNFMHGTHVGAIAIEDAMDSKMLAVKLIPTEVKLPGQESSYEKGLGKFLVKKALGVLAKQQMVTMSEIGYYVDGHNVDVANGSFGTGYAQAEMIITMLYKTILRKEPSKEDLTELAHHFLSTMLEEGKKFVATAPKTLFVFAAGNDGSNNDLYPTSPTNIKADNVISVGATLERNSIASFSNFGAKTVDVAAPGVAIESASPGDNYIKVSGTSQAAPYVANIALKIKEINKELSPKALKKIIMNTVDKKAYLAGKVKTEGIVNTTRALRAAFYSTSRDLETSIKMANEEVADIKSEKGLGPVYKTALEPAFIMPLPSPFKI
jgi:subtilisin family serine protease